MVCRDPDGDSVWPTPARAQSLPGGFVFLRDVDPTIIQDIRYAGRNNFVGRPLASAIRPANAW